ncbi:hypothetical protein K7G98_17085 [Saccharothrix sp. MB29]|nr:hypothetical protein [Saccharothrix sp. MB29]
MLRRGADRGGFRAVGAEGGHLTGEVPVGDDERGPGVVQHPGDPSLRVGGVQREVSRTGPEHGQQRDDEVRTAGEGDRDEPLRSGAAPGQAAGQRLRAAVQLGVGERPVPGDDGHAVRVGGDGGGEAVEQVAAGGAAVSFQRSRTSARSAGASRLMSASRASGAPDTTASARSSRVLRPRAPVSSKRSGW